MNRQEGEQILRGILDLGEELIKTGAENWRAEDSLYRLCRAYGFRKINIWLIPSNIQATVETPGGDIITQVRYVPAGGANFEKLDALNNLSRRLCAETPGADKIAAALAEIERIPPQPKWKRYLAYMLGGGCFAVFFNCNFQDAVVAVMASVLVAFLSSRLAVKEPNPLIYNAILSFIAEFFIIVMVHFVGLGDHISYITIGVVMLLIGGVGITNGIRDLFNKDIFSGIINISTAVLGAAGIAIGIAMPILMFKGVM